MLARLLVLKIHLALDAQDFHQSKLMTCNRIDTSSKFCQANSMTNPQIILLAFIDHYYIAIIADARGANRTHILSVAVANAVAVQRIVAVDLALLLAVTACRLVEEVVGSVSWVCGSAVVRRVQADSLLVSGDSEETQHLEEEPEGQHIAHDPSCSRVQTSQQAIEVVKGSKTWAGRQGRVFLLTFLKFGLNETSFSLQDPKVSRDK